MMAPAPKKPCSRCHRRLTVGRYCAVCQVVMDAKKVVEDRPSATARGYDGRWKKIRDMKIQRSPLCERCLVDGFTVAAVLVHHMDRDSSNNADSNHQSLCLRCHQLEHRMDGRDSLRGYK